MDNIVWARLDARVSELYTQKGIDYNE